MSKPHVGISVSNIAKAAEWFSRFGYEPYFHSFRTEAFLGEIVGCPGVHAHVWYLEGPGPMIELLQYAPTIDSPDTSPTLVGNGHLALMVDKLDLEGLEVIGSSEIPDGPNKGMKVAYVRGPDGFTVELMKT